MSYRPARPSPAARRSAPCCQALEPRVLLAAALLTDINTQTPGSNPHGFFDLNGTVLFRANDGVHAEDWWRSDGTPQGTRLVKDMDAGGPNNGTGAPRRAVVVGDDLYFVGYSTAAGYELWKTDGTEAGTVMVKDVAPGTRSSESGNFVALGDTLFFSEGRNLWRSDGTEAGTVVIGQFGSPKPLAAVGGKVVFQAAAPTTSGSELWTTDGTAAGTVFLKDINPGPAGSEPGTMPLDARVDDFTRDRFLVGGGVMYFAATTAAQGRELWQTDGTPGGTRLVADALPGTAGSSPSQIVAHQGAIYFAGQDPGTYRLDLFRVGADGATSLVHHQDVAVPLSLSSTGDRLFYATRGPLNATDIYLLDAAGTAMTGLRQLPATFGSAVSPFVELGGAVYFGVGPGITGTGSYFELWRTDGTTAGTTSVRGYRPVTASVRPELLKVGNLLYFAGSDGAGSEPFVSDGTRDGTRMLLDINSVPTRPANPTRPVGLNGRWLFAASDGSVNGDGTNRQLWSTDGTAAGTRKVLDPTTRAGFAARPETRVGYSNHYEDILGTPWNGRLYFAGYHEGSGTELISSDGTGGGTRLHADLYPGSDSSTPIGFTPFKDRLFFVTGAYSSHPATLWSTDGTRTGTVPVKRLTSIGGSLEVVGDTLYFSAADAPGNGRELWKSDGTEAGTVRVKEIYPGTTGSDPSSLTALGAHVYFTARHPDHGRELWRSDGTEAGTVLVMDTYPGAGFSQPNSGAPMNLAAVGGWLLFEATDYGPTAAGVGERLRVWRTDGTPEGTTPLTTADFTVGQINRLNLIEAGGVGYFFRQRRDHAPEMWRTDGTADGTTLVRAFETAGHVPMATPVGVNGGTVYVRAGEAQAGWAPAPFGNSELWESDGTAAGTRRLYSGGIGSIPGNAASVNGRVLFTADDGLHGNELWVAPPAARVVGRHVFYNRSRLDGNDPSANAADDAAVATDKAALRPGDAAGFAHVTSYTRGVNGIILDVADLPEGMLGAGDFTFQRAAGPGAGWVATAAPSGVSVRRGAGAGGADRVTLVWESGAVRNGWLRVTVKANDRTGVAADDVFAFGNLVGETGDAGSPLRVTPADFNGVRRAAASRALAGVSNPHDFNRDGRVDVQDLATVRGAMTGTLAPPGVAVGTTSARLSASSLVAGLRGSSRRGVYALLT